MNLNSKDNKGRLSRGIGLRFDSGYILKYKGTNIPQVFFSITSALENAKKYHPTENLTLVKIHFTIVEFDKKEKEGVQL